MITMDSSHQNLTRIVHAIGRLDLYQTPQYALTTSQCHLGAGASGQHCPSPPVFTRMAEAQMQKQTGLPEYALCRADLWGLTTIDYGLLSLFAYFHAQPHTLNQHLRTLFPGINRAPPRIVPLASALDVDDTTPDNVFWTEVEFAEKNLTVIAVRGTEFWRVSDWLEDVRMWTGRASYLPARLSVCLSVFACVCLCLCVFPCTCRCACV